MCSFALSLLCSLWPVIAALSSLLSPIFAPLLPSTFFPAVLYHTDEKCACCSSKTLKKILWGHLWIRISVNVLFLWLRLENLSILHNNSCLYTYKYHSDSIYSTLMKTSAHSVCSLSFQRKRRSITLTTCDWLVSFTNELKLLLLLSSIFQSWVIWWHQRQQVQFITKAKTHWAENATLEQLCLQLTSIK